MTARAQYTFTTGNVVEVIYDAGDGLRMEWTRWPPRQADVLEWRSIRRELIERVLPPGVTFAIVDEDSLALGCCAGCGDD